MTRANSVGSESQTTQGPAPGQMWLIWLLVAMGLSCSNEQVRGEPEPVEEKGLTVDIQRPIRVSEDLRVPQNDPGFDRAEVTPNTVKLYFRDPPKLYIEEGNVIIGTTSPNSFLRRVTAVTEKSDSLIAVQTEPAELTDAIVDGAFTIELVPEAGGWELDGDPAFDIDAFRAVDLRRLIKID